MKHILLMVTLVAVGLASEVSAHHSKSGFDMRNPITVSGVVTSYEWKQPHIYIYTNRITEDGQVEEYVLEGNALPALAAMGWNAQTFKVGDRVTATGGPNTDPTKRIMLLASIVGPDGKTYFSTEADYEKALKEHPELFSPRTYTASTDMSGIWSRTSATGRPPKGAFDVPDYPYTQIGEKQRDAYREEDNPSWQCVPLGVPREITSPFGMQIIREPTKIIVKREVRLEDRVVHLDQKDHSQMGEPSDLGHSIGWMEGDTLVVDTVNFLPKKWGLARGIDSSAQKHVIEKYTLEKEGTQLKVEFTVEDPEYITTPVTEVQLYSKEHDGYVMQSVPCDLEQALKFTGD